MAPDNDRDDPFEKNSVNQSANLPAVQRNEEDEEDFDSSGASKGWLGRYGKFAGVTLALLAISAGAFFLGSSYTKARDAAKDPKVVSGQTVESSGAMTESQLRDFVTSTGLTAYWSGPVRGYRYSIVIPKKGVVVIRYLPGGNGLKDTAPNYRVFGTYAQKGATEAVTTSGQKEGSIGFTNVDGNAVFYLRARPTNVYMAIKEKDIQIEIFDPGQDQAVALALFKGQIQQIK